MQTAYILALLNSVDQGNNLRGSQSPASFEPNSSSFCNAAVEITFTKGDLANFCVALQPGVP